MTARFYASSYARRGTTIPLFRQYPPQQTFTQLNLVDVYFFIRSTYYIIRFKKIRSDKI